MSADLVAAVAVAVDVAVTAHDDGCGGRYGSRGCGRCIQGHLGIYYYVEIRGYGMFGPWATNFPVLCCRNAGKLTSRSQQLHR